MMSSPNYYAVYCAGLRYGGSVFLHQCMSELVREHYKPEIPVIKLEDYEEYLPPHVEQGKAKLIVMYRDFRDTFFTMIRRRRINVDWVGITINDALFDYFIDRTGSRYLDVLMQYENCQPHISFRYEDFYPNKWHLMIQKAAEYLELKIAASKAKEIVEAFSIENNLELMKIADGTVPLEWNHIGRNQGNPGAYKWAFKEHQIKILEEIAGDWLIDHGYELYAGSNGE